MNQILAEIVSDPETKGKIMFTVVCLTMAGILWILAQIFRKSA